MWYGHTTNYRYVTNKLMMQVCTFKRTPTVMDAKLPNRPPLVGLKKMRVDLALFMYFHFLYR